MVGAYKEVSTSTTTPVSDTERKKVLIKLPKYSQTFDIAVLVEYLRIKSILMGQPYRVYLPDNTIKDQGIITEKSGTVRTDSAVKVRCEIGTGEWVIEDDGYDYDDLDQDSDQSNGED